MAHQPTPARRMEVDPYDNGRVGASAPDLIAGKLPRSKFDGNSEPDAVHTKSPRLRLLVVDDHVDTAKMLAMGLTISGFSVHTASTAQEALELADQHRFDLVVSDLGLP